MGSYPINKSPSMEDGNGGVLAFHEVRICLQCAAITDVERTNCPKCFSIIHTRTVLISHVTTIDDRPKVTIQNFGND